MGSVLCGLRFVPIFFVVGDAASECCLFLEGRKIAVIRNEITKLV